MNDEIRRYLERAAERYVPNSDGLTDAARSEAASVLADFLSALDSGELAVREPGWREVAWADGEYPVGSLTKNMLEERVDPETLDHLAAAGIDAEELLADAAKICEVWLDEDADGAGYLTGALEDAVSQAEDRAGFGGIGPEDLEEDYGSICTEEEAMRTDGGMTMPPYSPLDL